MEIVFFKIQVELSSLIKVLQVNTTSKHTFLILNEQNHATEFNTMKHLGYLALGVAIGVDPDQPASSDPQ